MRVHQATHPFHKQLDLFDRFAEQDFRNAPQAVRWIARRGRVPLSTALKISELCSIATWEDR
jgi:hypothetical protein